MAKSPVRKRSTKKVALSFNRDKCRTEQSHKDGRCSITRMLDRSKRGIPMPMAPVTGQFVDFVSVPESFHDAMDRVAAAKSTFDQLPSKIKLEFHNSIKRFVDFCSDPDNADRMVKLGIATRVEPPKASKLDQVLDKLLQEDPAKPPQKTA